MKREVISTLLFQLSYLLFNGYGSTNITKSLVMQYSPFFFGFYVAFTVSRVIIHYIPVDGLPNFVSMKDIPANIINIILDNIFLYKFII